MANFTVDTTTDAPLDIPMNVRPSLQNKGPGKVYMDFDPAVSTASGFEIAVNGVYEFPEQLNDASPNGQPLYAVSDADGTDLRYLPVG